MGLRDERTDWQYLEALIQNVKSWARPDDIDELCLLSEEWLRERDVLQAKVKQQALTILALTGEALGGSDEQ